MACVIVSWGITNLKFSETLKETCFEFDIKQDCFLHPVDLSSMYVHVNISDFLVLIPCFLIFNFSVLLALDWGCQDCSKRKH